MTAEEAKERGRRGLIEAFFATLRASLLTGAVGAILAGIGFLVSLVWTPAIDGSWDYAARKLGITALAEEQQDLAERLAALEPRAQIVTYDPNLSYIEGDACGRGQPCNASFRVRRTPHGQTCSAPILVPVVRNHGGVEHVAEILGVTARRGGQIVGKGSGGLGVKASEEWTAVTVQFRVPAAARPGRGVFNLRLLYVCDGLRLPPAEATPLPFRILAPRPD